MQNNNIQLYNYIAQAMAISLKNNILYKRRQFIENVLMNLNSGANNYNLMCLIHSFNNNNNNTSETPFYLYKLQPNDLEVEITNNFILNIYILKNSNRVGLFYTANLLLLLDNNIANNINNILIKTRKDVSNIDVDKIYNLFKTNEELKKIIRSWINTSNTTIINDIYGNYKDIGVGTQYIVMSLYQGYNIIVYNEKKVITSDIFMFFKKYIQKSILNLYFNKENDIEYIGIGEEEYKEDPILHDNSNIRNMLNIGKKINFKGTYMIYPALNGKLLNEYYIPLQKLYSLYSNNKLNKLSFNEFVLYLIYFVKENKDYSLINNYLIVGEKEFLKLNYIYPFSSDYLEEDIIWEVLSFSNVEDEGDRYLIEKEKYKKETKCNCPDFKYRGKKKGSCKHMNALYQTNYIVKEILKQGN